MTFKFSFLFFLERKIRIIITKIVSNLLEIPFSFRLFEGERLDSPIERDHRDRGDIRDETNDDEREERNMKKRGI